MNEQAKRLAANIMAILARRGMTVAELAIQTGLAKSTVYRICAADGSTAAARVEKIAKTLGVTYDELLGTPDPHPVDNSGGTEAKSIGRLVEYFVACSAADQRRIVDLAARLAAK